MTKPDEPEPGPAIIDRIVARTAGTTQTDEDNPAVAIAAAAAALYRQARETPVPNPVSRLAVDKLLNAARSSVNASPYSHDSVAAAIMLTALADKIAGRPEPVDPEVAAAAGLAVKAGRRLEYRPPEGFAELISRDYDLNDRTDFREFAAVWLEYNQ